MAVSSMKDILIKLSTVLNLVRSQERVRDLNKLSGLRGLTFVDVIYDECHGIKRPIGLVHALKMHGQVREVFTFCNGSRRQPNMALFVKKRLGNMSDDIALTFEGEEMIPQFLKDLPVDYRDSYFQTCPEAACCMAV